MKHRCLSRAKRAKNGTTMWGLTLFNTETGKSSKRKIQGTYDDITLKVNRIREKNHALSVCAEEMNKWGSTLLEDGRSIAVDSIDDERLFKEARMADFDDDGAGLDELAGEMETELQLAF